MFIFTSKTSMSLLVKRSLFSIIAVFFFFPYLSTLQDPFFWDTIQFAGKHGLFFFKNGLGFLPDMVDSGHIPFLGYYLSILWHLFGKTLLVSHLAMVPFLLLYLLFTFKISNILDSQNSLFIWMLFLFEPCLLTQSTLVSPDLLLMAGFAIMLYGTLGNHELSILNGSVLMVLAGNRGTAVVFAIGVVWLWQHKQTLLQKLLWLFPAFLIFCSYQLLHYHSKGWIGYHDGMPWAVSFERVGLIGILKNIGLMAWRLLDTGRISLCLIALFLFFNIKQNKTTLARDVLRILFAVSIILAVTTLPYRYLTGHRYYMPVYFLLIAFVSSSLPNHWALIKKRILYTFILSSFILGHFIIYPKGIAMGWDSTLAYLPYQKLREEVIGDLDGLGLFPKDVGSYFPNVSGFEATDLSTAHGVGFAKDNPLSKKYVLISNVMNDVPDHLIDDINNSWIVEKEWHSGSIYFMLMSKK